MNLKTIPDPVWDKLAAAAIQARRTRASVRSAVDNMFYTHIYETWSQDKVKYKPNMPGSMDGGWSKMVREWWRIQNTPGGIGSALGDDSYGQAGLQIDRGADALKMARLWEIYNNRTIVSRFQFVVSSGAGIVLFNRMRRACQNYLHKRLQGDTSKSAIQGWKVFGEAGGLGRSDSCVVYLTASYKSPSVIVAVESYIWPGIKDLVEDQFVPLGFFPVAFGKPLWALDLPDESREQRLLGDKSGGSAGGLMALVLGLAYSRAVRKAGTDKPKLIQSAKSEAEDLVEKLYA